MGDAKSQKKYDGGRAAKVQTILGLIYDCTDPTNPTTGLPEAKQRDLFAKVKALAEMNTINDGRQDLESVTHKLSAAAMALERDRVYLCGFYAALRGKEVKGKVKFTR